MKNILFVFVAAALVSITPFLALFDKDCFPNHGLICFSILLILLLYKNISSKSISKKRLIGTTAITYIAVVSISLLDTNIILNLLQKSFGIYAAIPFITTVLALLLLKNVPAIPAKHINLIAFSTFALHFILVSTLNQPLLDFTLLKYVEIPQNELSKKRLQHPDSSEFKYEILNTTSITKEHIDTTKSNVIILVESWGVPLESNILANEFGNFKYINVNVGIHKRNFSHTVKAEKEDLTWQTTADSNANSDTMYIPNYLESIGFKTYHLAQNSNIEDSVAIQQIDSLLNNCDSLCFISFTTADTKFSTKKDINELTSKYFSKLNSTLGNIAKLIEMHPNTNFVIQGDHEPILSPIEFQNQFYKRWVPFVIFSP